MVEPVDFVEPDTTAKSANNVEPTEDDIVDNIDPFDTVD